MNEIKKYIVLKGGLTCRPVNPYPLTEPAYYRMGDIVIDHPNSEYNDFEANAPTLPIATSTPMIEGVVFEGKERFQYKLKIETDWTTDFGYQITGKDYDYFEHDLKTKCNDFETRLLIEPQTVQEDKVFECMDCNSHSFKKQVGGCPNCGSVHIQVMPEHKNKKPLPTTGNKEVETVDEAAVKWFMANHGIASPNSAFKAGAQWQQSLSSSKDLEQQQSAFIRLLEDEITALNKSRHINEDVYTTQKRLAKLDALTGLLSKAKEL